ncbi:MAG: 3D domain-containing protein [Rhodospirillaceae bacterium]
MSDTRRNPAKAGHDVSNEPRIPAGNGRESGEWTEEGLSRSAKAILKQNCPNGHSVIPMNVSAYTNGPESTGKWPGDPGYGITKHGTRAGPGTIAAPPAYAFGTKMYVPGYGWGTVQDIGGAIKGNRLDVWFETEKEAKRWGRQNLDVVVCKG